MRLRSLVAAVWAAFAVAPAARAKVLLTQEEALRLAFPGARVEARTAFLTDEQRRAAKSLSGEEELPSALVRYYAATKDGRAVGEAYFDTHVVRTMPETVMVVVAPDARIARIEVLSFSEPEEYLPRARWYQQFQGKPLDDELSLKRAIHPVSGATLTSRATTDAARRVLALYQILHAAPGAPASATPAAPGGAHP
jgi:Na+-translocating ferredoxin:NAD+ oxidoreductase RnfG subunit